MGAAGDMLMAALSELLPDKQAFIKNLNEVGIDGVKVVSQNVNRYGISGTDVSVLIKSEGKTVEEGSHDIDPAEFHAHLHEHSHGHDEHDTSEKHLDEIHQHHEHEHRHTKLSDIHSMINALNIPNKVKDEAIAVYDLIAKAEGEVHGRTPGDVHFHEVGRLDAIADIVGVCLALNEIAPDKIIVSPINVGSGMVGCAHGVVPVPAPATAILLKGMLSYSGPIMSELCTPTGAALLKHFCNVNGRMPFMKTEKIGYGFGKKKLSCANVLRVFLGDSIDEVLEKENEPGSVSVPRIAGPNERICELSCNIDDMTAESIAFACEKLIEEGALDAYTTPIVMKKGRPATMINCICKPEEADKFAELLLKHTTTFGVRKATFERYALNRDIKHINTPFGDIRVKTGNGYGIEKSKPEYEDIKRIAKENDCSLKEANEYGVII
jgi:uncharacterized protein (TIGR00299 family) protein